MSVSAHKYLILMSIVGLSLVLGARPSFSAAGAPPSGPIEAAHTGAALRFACGQEVEGYKDVVGELMLKSMLIVQCRAVLGAVAEMVKAGQITLDDKPKWQCVEIPEDLGELSATFVTWVGRRPTLLRKPAAVALVEAIELSAPCK